LNVKGTYAVDNPRTPPLPGVYIIFQWQHDSTTPEGALYTVRLLSLLYIRYPAHYELTDHHRIKDMSLSLSSGCHSVTL